MMYSTFLQSVGNYKYSLQKSQGKEEFFLYFLPQNIVLKPDSCQSRYQRGLGLLDLALCVDTSGKSSVECRSRVINYQIASTWYKVSNSINRVQSFK